MLCEKSLQKFFNPIDLLQMVKYFLILSTMFFLFSCHSYWMCDDKACSSGIAKLKSKECDVYEGEVKNSKPNGFGKQIHAGDTCVKEESRGVPPGTIFEGIWGENKNGDTRLMGKATIFYPNGYKVTGTFLNDEIQDGPGSIKLPNHTVINGNWIKGNLCVGACDTGSGTSYFTDGFTFRMHQGNFKNTQYDGKGITQIEKTYYLETVFSYQLKKEGTFSNNVLIDGKVTCNKNFEKYCKHEFHMDSLIANYVKPNRNVQFVLE